MKQAFRLTDSSHLLTPRSVLTVLLMVVAGAAGLMAQTPQYYNYQNVGASSNSFPFGQNAGKKVQWLLLPNDLTQPAPCPPGNSITKVYFYVSTAGSRTFTDFTISMGQTSISTLPTGAWYDGPMQVVKSSPSIALTGVLNSWMSVELDTPFPYDPTQGLIIEVNQCGSSGTGISVRQNALTGFRRSWSGTTTPCPFLWGGQDASIVNFGVDVVPSGIPGWTTQTSGITTALYSVRAVSGSVAWAAGAGGVVLRTTDGGGTWTNVGGGAIGSMDLYNIDALNATTAFVTGTPSTVTYIFRTTNGGTSWDTVFTQSGGFINAIRMFNASNGIAQGDPVTGKWTILQTTDGGTTWARTATEPTQVGTEAGSNNGLEAIGSTHIWFITSNSTPPKVYRTTDGGATWNSGFLPGSATFTAGLAFLNTQIGIAGANNGTAARTTDGGATWNPITVGTTGTIYGMAKAGTLDFWATRDTTIQVSKDRGVTWTQDFSDATSGTIWHTNFVTSGNIAKGWTVTGSGKIYAYFNPVSLHDLGVQSISRVVVGTSPLIPSDRGSSQVPHPKDGVDVTGLVDDGADGVNEGGMEIIGIQSRNGSSLLADTVGFRTIVKNFGTFNEPTYQLGWQIDGVSQTPHNRGPLAAGATDTIALQLNQGTNGPHTLRAWTTLSSDGNPANDTATFNFLLAGNFWAPVATSPNALSRSCVSYIEINDTGYVYQFGGGAGAQLMSVARYNTVTNTWSTAGLATMPASISSGTAVTVGGDIFVFGGDNTAGLGRTLKYNVSTNTWTQLVNMPTLVTDAAVVKYRDTLIYVIGGGDGLFSPTPTLVTTAVQLYNTNTNSYTSATSYPLAAAMMGFGIYKDTIITAGGWNGTAAISNAYRGVINPANPLQITWTAIPAYPVGAVTRSASMFVSRGTGGGVMIAGGAIGGSLLTAKAYLWNFCNNAWEQLDTFATPRSNMKAAGKGDHIAWVVAGFTTVGVGTSDKVTFTNIPGGCITVGVDEEIAELPQQFSLAQNYPNPFNPSTTISYGLPTASQVSLKIYNVLGQSIATLRDEIQGPGAYSVQWDNQGSSTSSGVYFYRLEAKPVDGSAPYTGFKKMILLK